jgi:hypothetical protein
VADIPTVDSPVAGDRGIPAEGGSRTRAADSRVGADSRVVRTVVDQAGSVAGRTGVRSPVSISGASAHRIILSVARAFLKPLGLWSLVLVGWFWWARACPGVEW